MIDYELEQAELHRSACSEIDARGLRDFLDWLCSPNKVTPQSGVRVCARDAYGAWGPLELGAYGERIFAEYFGIDLDAVEGYKRRLLYELGHRPLVAKTGGS